MASSPSIEKAQTDLGLISDTRGLDKLRKMGTGDEEQQAQALYAAAQQFESLLMQYWVDGMRESTENINPDSSMNSHYSGFFEDMLAQQRVGAMVASNSKNSSGGINKNSITYMITKQFAGSYGDAGKRLMARLEGRDPDSVDVTKNADKGERDVTLLNTGTPFRALDPHDRLPAGFRPAAIYAASKKKGAATVEKLNNIYTALPDPATMRNFASREEFVEKMMPYAIKATDGTGINPLVLVAQAALETGWGKHVPAGNNYYGIKAGSSWRGATQDLASPEFERGHMVTRRSRFRAYPSVLESMQDYISFITGNQRYAKAADKSFDPDRYFEEIQKAGYATDPHYAKKLKEIARQIVFMAQK